MNKKLKQKRNQQRKAAARRAKLPPGEAVIDSAVNEVVVVLGLIGFLRGIHAEWDAADEPKKELPAPVDDLTLNPETGDYE